MSDVIVKVGVRVLFLAPACARLSKWRWLANNDLFRDQTSHEDLQEWEKFYPLQKH